MLNQAQTNRNGTANYNHFRFRAKAQMKDILYMHRHIYKSQSLYRKM